MDDLERLARKIARGDRSLATAEAYLALLRSAASPSQGWVEFTFEDRGEFARVLSSAEWPPEFPASALENRLEFSGRAISVLHALVPHSSLDEVTLSPEGTAAIPDADGATHAYRFMARPRRTARVVEVRVEIGDGEWRGTWRLRGTLDARNVRTRDIGGGDVVGYLSHAPVSLARTTRHGDLRSFARGDYWERPRPDGLTDYGIDWTWNSAPDDVKQALIESDEWMDAVSECIRRAERIAFGE